MTIISPKNRWEMADMIRFAADFPYPIAVRYPRGEAYEGMKQFRSPICYGKSELLYEEEKIVIIFVGHMAELADQVITGDSIEELTVLQAAVIWMATSMQVIFLCGYGIIKTLNFYAN